MSERDRCHRLNGASGVNIGDLLLLVMIMRVTVVVGTYNKIYQLHFGTRIMLNGNACIRPVLLFSNDCHISHLNIKNQRIHS